MKRSKQILSLGGGIIILVIVFSIGRCTAPDNHARSEIHQLDAHKHEVHTDMFLFEEVQSWSCSMHPQIHQSEPGQCPICGMDLIALENHRSNDQGPRVLTMSKSAEALADIQTSTVQKRFVETDIRLVGLLDYDETRVRSLTARFPARIDRLFVNFNGVIVNSGEHLAQIYSPELHIAMNELLTAHRYNPNSSVTKSAKEKLRLWGLLPKQVDRILKKNKASEKFELLAPMSGVVVQKKVNEGDYVETGQALFKIVDLSHLWLRLEAYESDLAWLRFAQRVEFTVEAFPGKTFEGHISFIEPELNRKTRTVSIRVNVANTDRRLKPGMFAKARVKALIAKDGLVYSPGLQGKWVSPMHPEIVKDRPGQCDICGMDLVPIEKLGYDISSGTEAPIIVPASSVLKTGKRSVVYVKKIADKPTYEGREIILGPRAGDFYLVLSGLKEGEQVVTHGAFKIDSALQIQARPSMMNPETGRAAVQESQYKKEKPAAEFGKSDTTQNEFMAASTEANTKKSAALGLDFNLSKRLLPYYFSLHSALAEDNFELAKNVLQDMMAVADNKTDIANLINIMFAAQSIETLRKPNFDKFSRAMIQSVSQNAAALDQPVYQMYCPMVYGDRGASWLQANDTLRNPYYGSTMLKCGELQAVHGSDLKLEKDSHEH